MGLISYIIGKGIREEIRQTSSLIYKNNLYQEIPLEKIRRELMFNSIHDSLYRLVQFGYATNLIMSTIDENYENIIIGAVMFNVAFVFGRIADKKRRSFLEDVELDVLRTNSK